MRRLGRTGKKDGNHDVVVKAIEDLGWYVISTAGVGYGCPDAFAAKGGRLVAIEIKDPNSARGLKLSPKEREVHRQLRARGVTVEILTGNNSSLDVLREPFRNMYDAERQRGK